MPLSRRQFVVSAASLAGGAATARTADSQTVPGSDPLGVRGDFPIVRDRHYLNSAYITPVPSQVVAAGRAFVESKALRPRWWGRILSEIMAGLRHQAGLARFGVVQDQPCHQPGQHSLRRRRQILPRRSVYQGAGPFLAEQLYLLLGSAPTCRACRLEVARLG